MVVEKKDQKVMLKSFKLIQDQGVPGLECETLSVNHGLLLSWEVFYGLFYL